MARYHKNSIKTLQERDDTWAMTDQDLGRILKNYFKNLFSLEPISLDLWDDLYFRTLGVEQQQTLIEPITDEEVYKTLQHIGKWKTPGPDGFHVGFYTKNWDLVEMKSQA